MSHFSSTSQRAFTLVELLIVVVIIAIITAIAVPNFLEAQTRAKVARVRSDFRTIATAIELYCLDHNKYPIVNNSFSSLKPRLQVLTTPVSYLSEIPTDSFERDPSNFAGKNSLQDPSGKQFLYNTSNINVGFGNAQAEASGRGSWSLTSGGPDRNVSFPYYAFSQSILNSQSHLPQIYDPTNGTISSGDIFGRGGSKLPAIPEIDL